MWSLVVVEVEVTAEAIRKVPCPWAVSRLNRCSGLLWFIRFFLYQIFNPVGLQKFLLCYKMAATVLEVFPKSPHFQNPDLLSGGEQTVLSVTK